jgi:mannosyltransferase OCH1-like enzyme
MVKSFPKGVMIADFWRYSIMYSHGGIYLDLDTLPVKPIK